MARRRALGDGDSGGKLRGWSCYGDSGSAAARGVRTWKTYNQGAGGIGDSIECACGNTGNDGGARRHKRLRAYFYLRYFVGAFVDVNVDAVCALKLFGAIKLPVVGKCHALLEPTSIAACG